MSTGTDPDAVPTTRCRVCETDVPAGVFCGLCGVPLTVQPGDGPPWLRLRVFGAAPGEHLLRPALASTLFPHLPYPARSPFRVGLLAIAAGLALTTVLRLPAALITVAALGLPLLFVIYLRESEVFRDLPRSTLLLTAVLGAGLGLGWGLVTAQSVPDPYHVPLGTGVTATRILRDGIAIPLGTLVVLLIPAVVVRFTRRSTREALEGFAIGALGALVVTAASTLTRLAPQLTVGVLVQHRPRANILVEAVIGGVTIPVITASAGGLIGAALWFRRPASKAHQHPGFVRAALAGFGAVVVVCFVGVGLADIAPFPQYLQLALHVAVAAVALLTLRLGMHLALLHEAHDDIRAAEPLLCPHCGHVVPDMAFCPACGVATRASSRTSRTARRRTRPVRIDPGRGP